MCIRDRDRTGKSARIAEKIRKKIGIDVDVKPETVTEENVAPAPEAPKEDAPVVEAAPVVETPKEEAAVVEATNEETKSESSSEKKIIFFQCQQLYTIKFGMITW